MTITINGRKEELQADFSVNSYLIEKKIEPSTVVIEYNLNILPKEDWAKTQLKNNDKVEILRFVGGGQ